MPKLRPLPSREICKILQSHGFSKNRQTGSHIIMQLALPGGDTRTVIVPNHAEVAVGTLNSIIKQSGLDASLFRR
jgi:predicted RNA binding protein YcfA (HicA-like mRNA interferase family)